MVRGKCLVTGVELEHSNHPPDLSSAHVTPSDFDNGVGRHEASVKMDCTGIIESQ